MADLIGFCSSSPSSLHDRSGMPNNAAQDKTSGAPPQKQQVAPWRSRLSHVRPVTDARDRPSSLPGKAQLEAVRHGTLCRSRRCLLCGICHSSTHQPTAASLWRIAAARGSAAAPSAPWPWSSQGPRLQSSRHVSAVFGRAGPGRLRFFGRGVSAARPSREQEQSFRKKKRGNLWAANLAVSASLRNYEFTIPGQSISQQT